MNPFNLLIDKIHRGTSPYVGFPDGWGGVWYSDPGAMRDIFGKSIQLIQPSLIIEVGSFVGESAIHMAQFLKSNTIECAILCVDTFYGGYDHHVGAPEKFNMHFGRPDFFNRFMANVIANHCQDVIVPLASDSITASRVIKRLEIVPQLVYIDASHEQGDVIRDLEAYWSLLPSGGGLLMDDLTNHFPGCLHDWESFVLRHNLKTTLAEGEKALVVKP